MPTDGYQREIGASVFARLGAAARYAITGEAPDSWFGPQTPLAPQAPPDVKGRRFDYPFGVNLSYTPRVDASISFAELRALADALPLLRLVIETRKDQIAGLNYTVRSRDPRRTAAAAPRIASTLAFLARPDRRLSFAAWLRTVARGHAGHRRRDALPALYARRRSLCRRRDRRLDHHAAGRRRRPHAGAARSRLSASAARRARRGLSRPTSCSICRAIRDLTSSTA